jgi:DNA-binding transcriptional regulator GbsR (MarR family)
MTAAREGQLVRFFERFAKWIGLSENTGPVVAVLFKENFEGKNRLSADEIRRRTNYSRANTGLILTQLELMGIVDGQKDYGQKGRGRRRVLYSITKSTEELLNLGISRMDDGLNEMLSNLTALKSDFTSSSSATKMLKAIERDVKKTSKKIQSL